MRTFGDRPLAVVDAMDAGVNNSEIAPTCDALIMILKKFDGIVRVVDKLSQVSDPILLFHNLAS